MSLGRMSLGREKKEGGCPRLTMLGGCCCCRLLLQKGLFARKLGERRDGQRAAAAAGAARLLSTAAAAAAADAAADAAARDAVVTHAPAAAPARALFGARHLAAEGGGKEAESSQPASCWWRWRESGWRLLTIEPCRSLAAGQTRAPRQAAGPTTRAQDTRQAGHQEQGDLAALWRRRDQRVKRRHRRRLLGRRAGLVAPSVGGPPGRQACQTVLRRSSSSSSGAAQQPCRLQPWHSATLAALTGLASSLGSRQQRQQAGSSSRGSGGWRL